MLSSVLALVGHVHAFIADPLEAGIQRTNTLPLHVVDHSERCTKTQPCTTDNEDGRCLLADGVLGARRDDPDGLLHIQRNGDAIHHMDLPEVFPK